MPPQNNIQTRHLAATDADILRRGLDLQNHLKSLSLTTLNDYVEWCQKNGFGTSLAKNWRDRCREKHFASRSKLRSRQQRIRREKRRPAAAIGDLFDAGSQQRPELKWLQRCDDLVIRINCQQTSDAFQQLLLHVQSHAKSMLDVERAHPAGHGQHNTLIDGLAALAAYHKSWIRALERWRPDSKNPRRQFSSLARYLLATWPTPTFMDCVWFGGNPLLPQVTHQWFIRLGNGTPVRHLRLPLPLTRKMSRHFLETPDGLGIVAALRRAQVLGCGGNQSLVSGVLASRMMGQLNHHDFWTSVIRWLVACQPRNSSLIAPIIDFIHFEKFQRAGGNETCTDYSLAGRSLGNVVRDMLRWHRGLHNVTELSGQSWPAHPDIHPLIGQPSFKHSRPPVVWSIEQILSVGQLLHEGQRLRHCVLSYAQDCLSGKTTIWSLGVQQGVQQRRSRVTIEVVPDSRVIRQARGKSNRHPKSVEASLIRQWAMQQDLQLGPGSGCR